MRRQRGNSSSSRRPRSKPAFYLDENVPESFGVFLRARGCNATSAADMPGKTDLQQLVIATRERRIFVTHDRDLRGPAFTERRIQQSAGVIILASDDPSEQLYVTLARHLLSFLERRSIVGRLGICSIAGVRERSQLNQEYQSAQ